MAQTRRICSGAILAFALLLEDAYSGSGRAAASAAQSVSPRKALAHRAQAKLRIDGSLNEPDWSQAIPIGPLLQREPNEGAPATEETETRVLFDDDALYFGIVCRDRNPRAIVATQLTRDAELDVDDYVLVILDPFFEHRSGFFFEVNPAGARADGQVANNDERRNYDWDGIWNASARTTQDGWIVEIEIPFKTLRFKPGQTVWGLNVERYIKRRQESDRWSGARRDIWISNLAEAGMLEGLGDARQGRGLDVRPYVSAGRENSERQLDVGIDVSKNLTPNLNASFTVNTDFAETEVDARQINLTRFPLIFPEKRSFFLEGAGVFQIAGLSGRNQDLFPFFSRRIGLLGGQEIPILAGIKMTGRPSGYNIGFLNVQTRPVERRDLEGQNLFAGRVTRNFFKQSWIGAIVTHGNPEGTGSNLLIGADARFATSDFRNGKNLSLDLFLFRTRDDGNGIADYAGGFKVDYPNDLWDVALTWKQIGENFRPALGFVPRRGIRRTDIGIEFKPRPKRWGIRQFFFVLEPEIITDLNNEVENWRVLTAPLIFRTESGETIGLFWGPEFERLDEPFEISEGIVIPPGSYQWSRYLGGITTASKRPWVLDLEWSNGSFYRGRRREIQFGLLLKPNTHLALEFELERNDIRLPQGKFYTQIFSFQGNYNFSPNVSWANLVQYDNESRILGFQSRFRWILKPGNDLFLVLNRGWVRDPDGNYERSFDKGSVKLQYTFRY